MKFLFVLCIVAVLSGSALGVPEQSHALLVRSRRDLLQNITQFIQNLITRLQNAGKEALDAVSAFSNSITSEVQQIREKIINDIDRFKNRVTDAIENVYKKFSDTSNALNDCVETHRDEAADVFNNTASLAMACVDQRIDEIGELIEQLKIVAAEALREASTAVKDMRQCAKDSVNILTTGTCLGSVAMNVEMKSFGLFSQSTVLIGRINLSIASLPASLEVCAGTRILHTGIQTSKIIIDLGTCSASAIFNNITGSE
ncbi:unnamed protein product [Arctia plantaginis]|uniref:Uncharacterized protein n=1 Tax=Arctia plantaginis TaxID=874455 RepID=A0A8S1A274_ARCPL|nr:unnamed protein product [Arctia plantaginis]